MYNLIDTSCANLPIEYTCIFNRLFWLCIFQTLSWSFSSFLKIQVDMYSSNTMKFLYAFQDILEIKNAVERMNSLLSFMVSLCVFTLLENCLISKVPSLKLCIVVFYVDNEEHLYEDNIHTKSNFMEFQSISIKL